MLRKKNPFLGFLDETLKKKIKDTVFVSMSEDLFEFVRKFRPFGLKPLSSRDRVRDLLKFAKRRSRLRKGDKLFDVGDPSVRFVFSSV